MTNKSIEHSNNKIKDISEYNSSIFKKTHDCLQQKESLGFKVPAGYYRQFNEIVLELYAIKTVMKMDEDNQILDILEMFYDKCIDKLNADLEKKKIPQNLRFIHTYDPPQEDNSGEHE
jgi:hypothetical protein